MSSLEGYPCGGGACSGFCQVAKRVENRASSNRIEKGWHIACKWFVRPERKPDHFKEIV